MGWGDEVIATGLARGAASRGKRIAFGNRRFIIWDQRSHEIFRGNPNIAPPGSEKARDIEWIEYYKGHRLYGNTSGGHWRFNDFECREGEVYLTRDEMDWARGRVSNGVIVIEPRVKDRGACAGANKQWPVERYQIVADELRKRGWVCIQLVPSHARSLLNDVETVNTSNFRHALAVLERASLYIGPEGGLHHGAAAMGTNAVVIFGGFNTPRSTGYSWHHNIAMDPPCGKIEKCGHCRKVMESISAEMVVDAALKELVRVKVGVA